MENVGYGGLPSFGGVSGEHYRPIDPRPDSFKHGFANSRQIQSIPFRPTSVLHPLVMSPNGFGKNDAFRRIYTGSKTDLLPTSNGQSAQTYKKSVLFEPYRQLGS